MRFCSIASGSSGNCVYVDGQDTRILIDIGISAKKVRDALSVLDVDPASLSGILITHEHSDHISGLGAFLRKFSIPVYATRGTVRGIKNYKPLGPVPEGIFREISPDLDFILGDLTIHPFLISHDANEPSAYRVTCGGKSVAVATDMGIYDDYIVENLKKLDAVLIEANHDELMLKEGPYPVNLKNRVSGETGHLSNELTGRLLCDIIHPGLRFVMLGHLSKENNYPDLAKETVKLTVSLADVKGRGDVSIVVAERDRMSKVLEV